jgi:hypothetical protein
MFIYCTYIHVVHGYTVTRQFNLRRKNVPRLPCTRRQRAISSRKRIKIFRRRRRYCCRGIIYRVSSRRTALGEDVVQFRSWAGSCASSLSNRSVCVTRQQGLLYPAHDGFRSPSSVSDVVIVVSRHVRDTFPCTSSAL